MIPDETLAALGRVAISAGKLETMAGRLVRVLISRDDEVARLLTRGWSFAKFADHVPKLVEARLQGLPYPDLQPYSEEWLRFSKSAMAERNKLLHGFWHEGADTAQLAGDDESEFREVPLSEIDHVRWQLRKAAGNGFILYLHIAAAFDWNFGITGTYEYPALPPFHDIPGEGWDPPASWIRPNSGAAIKWIDRQNERHLRR